MEYQNGKTERFDLSWGECAVESAGSGQPLVLVHGFPMDRRLWSAQMGVFPGWRSVAPDLRGLGKSVTTDHAGTMADYADDLAELLDAMNIKKAVVAGLSMGGYILFEMWRRHAHRIAGLAFVSTRAAADSATAARGRLEAKRRVKEVGTSVMSQQMPERLTGCETPSAVMDRLRDMISEAPPTGVIAALDAMRLRADSTNVLPSISVATLVVAGVADKIVSVDEMRGMAAGIPRSRFCEIENAGHVPPMERPGEFNNVMSEFLRALP